METLSKYFRNQYSQLKKDGFLTVLYALLAEALFIGFLFFAAFFTIETLLPTFVTVRFSLTKFLSCLVLLSFILAALGHSLEIEFPWKVKKGNPLFWLFSIWAIGILSLSLFKFPPFLIPIILIGFLFAGYLFAKILLFEDK